MTPPRFVEWLCPLGIAVIAGADYLAGPSVRLDPMYYAPVGYGAWRGGSRRGLALSALSALARAAATLAGGGHQGAHVVAINAGMQLLGCAAIAVLTARVSVLLAAEHASARRDPLTGLHNARALGERFAIERARAQRAPDATVVASLDLDRFKEVNDRWGHPTGDAALKRVAEILAQNLRATDTVARVGGDEFIAVLWATDAEEAMHVLRRLSARIKAAMSVSGWPVTTSIGATVFHTGERSLEEMITRADRALYRAKDRGGDALEIEVAP